MKRLIIVSMIVMSVMMQAEEGSSLVINNLHQINLDTIGIEGSGSGNWLEKRIWFERAEASFDEIRALVSQVADLRMQFTNEVNTVGQKIDSFIENVYFNKNELDDKLKEMLTSLDTEQKITGDLSEMERNLQTTIKQELPAIEQIGKDIKAVTDVDKKIDDTLMQAYKTIDECRDYETKAWDTFKAIGKELDDKNARNLYYQMNNFKQNIDQKNSYLKSTLLPYLHNVLVAKIETNIARINENIEKLKTKGVDLQAIMTKTQEDDSSQLKDREKLAVDSAVAKALEEERVKAKEIADKSALALEEANKKSFSNVILHYYNASIGKVVAWFYEASLYGSKLSVVDSMGTHVKSYSYPVATYIYEKVAGARVYMHRLVQDIMNYFKGASVNSKNIDPVSVSAENTIQKEAVVKTDVITPQAQTAALVGTSVAPAITTTSVVETPAPVSTPSVETPAVVVPEITTPVVATTETSVEAATAVTTTLTTETPAPVSTPSVETPAVVVPEITTPVVEVAETIVETPAVVVDQNVEIQSMKRNDSVQQDSTSLFGVVKGVLDLIGIVFTSVYNFIVQFFKLLWSFSSFVTSAK